MADGGLVNRWLDASESGDNWTMFNRSARWYDAFYANVDYEAEADRVGEIVRQLNSGARTLLDVACGTGRHLMGLSRHFDCAGVDIEPDMVAIARETLPGIPFEVADMVTLDLGRRFDAITCLFSSVGYTLTADRLDRAVQAMAGHLQPGGVLIVEPWITPAGWRGDGTTAVETVEQSTAKLVRVIASRRENDEATLAIHYVRAANGEIESEDERHRLGLFPPERYLEAFAAAGLDARWDDEGLRGRGLVTGVATADVGVAESTF